MRQKQFIAVILTVVMLFGILSGCAFGNEKDGQVTINVNGEKIKVDTMATIADQEISAQMYRYFFMNLKSSFDQGDESLWESNPTQVDYLKQTVNQYINNYAATLALAEAYGLELTEEDEQTIQNEINNAIEQSGSYALFEQNLSYSYLTEELFKELIAVELYSAKINDYLFGVEGTHTLSDSEFNEYIQNNYILSRHILIQNANENKEALVKEVQDKLDQGNDFRALEEQYSEDVSSTQNYPDGVCYTDGTMIEDFYNTALATPVGEISTVDTTEYGYFFINRLELTDTYIQNNYDTLYSEYCNEIYNDVMNDFMADAVYDYHDCIELIGIDAFA